MKKEITYLKRFVGSLIFGLTILFATSLFLNIRNSFNSFENLAKVEAQASYNKDLLYRRWNAMHGGVYVPVTDTTPPNPYLNHIPDRDIITKKGKELTLVNPAYMTRQVFALAKNQPGTKGHITSLNPIRKENKADEWETKALQIFETGATEYSSKGKIDGVEYLRYMQVMKVEESCLKCHAQQGYKVGDIRGGISVSVPMETYNAIAFLNIKRQVILYLVLFIIIIALICWGYKLILNQIQRSNSIQQKIAESEASLQKVNEKLNKTNAELNTAKDKAEESNRLKSAFLANMSHEIRTPMNGILGFTDLLKEPLLSNEKKDNYIHIINQSGKRLLNTVNDIVEISKIEAGLVNVNKSTINLIESLKNILSFFQLQAQNKNLSLNLNSKILETELFIFTDEGKLESILTNLIKNAIKYTDKGGITVSYSIKNDFIEFIVEDSGIGIPKNRQDAIFNRFEQADIEDKRALQGSGLGLAIAKSYVEMLGGRIWVESNTNTGSKFYFTIPLTPQNKIHKNRKAL